MRCILDFANSTAGLVASVGAFLTGVTSIVHAIQNLKRGFSRMSKMTAVPGVLGILLLLTSAVLLVGRAMSDEQPLNVVVTKKAWDAFNANHYEEAIRHADECIREFRGAANRKQAELASAKSPVPPVGTVSESEKTTILARGLLNDVATCYFIKGRAAERLERVAEARSAYKDAMTYTYARCWDPKGWFWSPAEVAADRLGALPAH